MKAALAAVSTRIDDLVAAPRPPTRAAAADETSRAEVVINDHLAHEEGDVEALMGDLVTTPSSRADPSRVPPAS